MGSLGEYLPRLDRDRVYDNLTLSDQDLLLPLYEGGWR